MDVEGAYESYLLDIDRGGPSHKSHGDIWSMSVRDPFVLKCEADREVLIMDTLIDAVVVDLRNRLLKMSFDIFFVSHGVEHVLDVPNLRSRGGSRFDSGNVEGIIRQGEGKGIQEFVRVAIVLDNEFFAEG